MFLANFYNKLNSDYKYVDGDSLFYVDGYFFLVKPDYETNIELYNDHDHYREPLKTTVRKFLDECILKGINNLKVSNYTFAKYFEDIAADKKLPVSFERLDPFNILVKF